MTRPKPPAHHFYVWYRIKGDPAAVRAAVNALMKEVTLQTGVIGRLVMRHDDPATWMEIYESVADAASFERALQQATARTITSDHLREGRHVECFRDAL